MDRKILAGLVMVALLSLALVSMVSAASGSDTVQPNIIISTATGEILTTPDRALISVGIETENPDVKVAQVDNAVIMTGIINALKSSGIFKDDIKTTGYSIYPVYDTTGDLFTKKVKSYQVTNTVFVTAKDITRAGDIIDLCVAAGANQVNSILFSLSPEKNRHTAVQP